LPTKAEILEKYRLIHEDLTRQFYVEKSIDKVTFETQHNKCWSDMQQELLANGYLKKQWNYTFGATISTAIGNFDLFVTIQSPIELTATQIQNNIDKIKQADWQLLSKKEEFIEA